jgi:hypothetical protein
MQPHLGPHQLSVVADGLDWTVLQRFVALGKLVIGVGLLVANVVILIVAHPKVIRSSVGADRAQDALFIDKKGDTLTADSGFTANVVFPCFFFIGHVDLLYFPSSVG